MPAAKARKAAKPTKPKSADSRQAEYHHRESKEKRDIGPMPDIEDIERRESCRDSLKLFCETYNRPAFYLGWSDFQLEGVARIQEAVTLGALYALAWPRGGGKSTICRMALLWGASYGLLRYLFLIGATSDKANDSLEATKMFMRFLPEYSADFPEISYPANRIGGIAQRASGQRSGEEPTLIEWAKNGIVLPTVRPSANWPKEWKLRSDGMVPTSGVVVGASGLTGEGIRGSLKTLTTGEQIRPDFVLLDDPQTDESAGSLAQNTKRLHLVNNTVLGMAGPNRTLAGVMPCTVIARGDMADETLDRKKHPMWRGQRSRMLSNLPTNLRAWDDYFDNYEACALLTPPDFTESNNYYIANRAVLDEGSVATWPERKLDTEVSAIQSAMHLYRRDRAGFMAEYQNEPLDVAMQPGVRRLVLDELLKRFTGIPRGVIPRDCSRVTGFIDPGRRVHWYCFVAWNEKFGGSVIDYGTWPEQRGRYFNRDDDSLISLAAMYPGFSEPEFVHQGLVDLCDRVLHREYQQHGTGGIMRAQQVIFDNGFLDKTVLDFIRTQKTTSTALISSKGMARQIGRSPIANWPKKDGEKRGHHWIKSMTESKREQIIKFDPDEWKSFVYNRLTEHVAGRSPLRLYGDADTDHRLFAGHLTAMCGMPEKSQGADFEKWKDVPNSGINVDFFDTLVGCAVAASVSGLEWKANESIEPNRRPAPISLRDLQEQTRGRAESASGKVSLRELQEKQRAKR